MQGYETFIAQGDTGKLIVCVSWGGGGGGGVIAALTPSPPQKRVKSVVWLACLKVASK